MVNDPGQEEVRSFAARNWPDLDWSSAVYRHGAFHDVLVCVEGPVLRTARGEDHERRTAREARTMLAVATSSLRTRTPSPLSRVISDNSRSGVLTTAIAGVERPDHDWDGQLQAAYRGLLDDLAAVPGAELEGLDPPRTWCGGQEWPTIVTKRLSPLLATEVAAAAETAVRNVIDLGLGPEADRGLVHGDFGRHNILWHGDAVSGLIDLDHSCIGDHAMDLAPLVVLHGVAVIEDAYGPVLTRRATTHAASLSLQIASAAELAGAVSLRDHALGNFVRRYRQGTLSNPTATRP